jgi:hypothetical protein
VPLIFSPESGEAIVGSERVSLVPVGDDGSVRLLDRSGSVIRPLRFGERSRLLIDALQSDDPSAFCSDLLVHAATNIPPDALTSAEKVLALLLAGGDIDAPTLSRTIAVVAGSTGWTLDIINTKTALEIDRIALDLVSRHSDWKKIVFPRHGADDVEAMIGEFISGLLRRVDEQIIQSTAEDFSPTAAGNTMDRANRSAYQNPSFGQEAFSPTSKMDYHRKSDARRAKRLNLSIDPIIASKSHSFREFKNAPGAEGGTDGNVVRYRDNNGGPSSVTISAGQRSKGFLQKDAYFGDRHSGKREAEKKENSRTKGDNASLQANKNLPSDNMKDLIQRLQLFPHPPVRRSSPGFSSPKSGNVQAHERTTSTYDGKSESGFRKGEPQQTKESKTFPRPTRSEVDNWTDIPPIPNIPERRLDPDHKDFLIPSGAQQKPPLPGNAVWPDSPPGQRTENPSPPNTISKLNNAAGDIFPVSYKVIPVEDTNKKQEGENTASAFDTLDLADLADGIGRLLSAEADLRGID